MLMRGSAPVEAVNVVADNLVSVTAPVVEMEPPPPVKKAAPAPKQPGVKVIKKKKTESRTPELVESDIARA